MKVRLPTRKYSLYEPGELTMFDESGPFSTVAIGGAKYVSMWCDAGTNRLEAIGMKSKKEIALAAGFYKREVLNHCGLEFQRVRCDGAGDHDDGR